MFWSLAPLVAVCMCCGGARNVLLRAGGPSPAPAPITTPGGVAGGRRRVALPIRVPALPEGWAPTRFSRKVSRRAARRLRDRALAPSPRPSVI